MVVGDNDRDGHFKQRMWCVYTTFLLIRWLEALNALMRQYEGCVRWGAIFIYIAYRHNSSSRVTNQLKITNCHASRLTNSNQI